MIPWRQQRLQYVNTEYCRFESLYTLLIIHERGTCIELSNWQQTKKQTNPQINIFGCRYLIEWHCMTSLLRPSSTYMMYLKQKLISLSFKYIFHWKIICHRPKMFLQYVKQSKWRSQPSVKCKWKPRHQTPIGILQHIRL